MPARFPRRRAQFAAEHLAIASALFGVTGALDPIPGYRLSHDSRLPGTTLGKIWRGPLAATLAERSGLILDLRSEGYADLGPAPAGSVYLRVVSEGADGRRRALNHFNKKGKGAFTRRLLLAGIDHPDVASLLDWARGGGPAARAGCRGRTRSRRLSEPGLGRAPALGEVVVDETRRLHECVHRGGPDEAVAQFAKRGTQRFGFGSDRRDVGPGAGPSARRGRERSSRSGRRGRPSARARVRR